MALNSTGLRGLCPEPFYSMESFGNDGFVDGRMCSQLEVGLFCCLPCPVSDWLYKDINQWYPAVESLNVISVILGLFLLISYAVLPAEKTRVHYLSICLILGVVSLGLGFVIPFIIRPSQCHDEITPNDMFSSLTCAWSGAFIIAGGLAIDVWVFLRALSMYLQICWDVIPGTKFFYAAQGFGWGIIAALFTATLTFTGTSFRFGEACHINSEYAVVDFWGPLLFIAAASSLVQFMTFAYCIKVYVKDMSTIKKPDQKGLALPVSNKSKNNTLAGDVYRRVRKVVWLQWRGMLLIMFVLLEITFFAIVFIYLDSVVEKGLDDKDTIMPWVECLAKTQGEKTSCYDLAEEIFIDQDVICAVLILLSIVGIQSIFLLCPWSLFTAWVDFFRRKWSRGPEFVSRDSSRFTANVRAYQSLKASRETTRMVPASTSSANEAGLQDIHSSRLKVNRQIYVDEQPGIVDDSCEKPYNETFSNFTRQEHEWSKNDYI